MLSFPGVEMGMLRLFFAKLFSLVNVADNDTDEEEGQWDDSPERIDMVSSRKACTTVKNEDRD